MASFLVAELGMRVDTVSPADDPTEIALSGSGTRLRLRRAAVATPGRLVVRSDRVPAGAPATVRTAPDGTVIEVVSSSDAVVVPDSRPSLSIVRSSDAFGTGRAGMGYRDLLPDRWGGRFVASHIRIADAGDVADYVHFHRIRFQMIYVAAGWVDVVYEDQGPPFRMHAGDCVLQPPEIRHRVLRSSAGLEVIEIGCPAVHDTVAEHDLALPTATARPERDFGGQRFVFHRASEAVTRDWCVPDFAFRDTGIATATGALAGVGVASATGSGSGSRVRLTHDGEFAMHVVLSGSAAVRTDPHSGGTAEVLGRGDAVALPPGVRWNWADWSDDFSLLEVTLPAGAVRAVEDR